jgi:hypothetical protein
VTREVVAFAFVVLVACGDDGAPAMDAGSEDGAIGIDGGADGAAVVGCESGSLSGDGPIARVVSGMAELTDQSGDMRTLSLEMEASIWLPAGRASGAEAFLSFQSSWPLQGVHVITSRVAEDGSVRFGIDAYHGDRELRATALLAGGTDVLELTITGWNLADSLTDVVDGWEGTAKLCAVSMGVGEPTLRAAFEARGFSPNAEIHLIPSAPIDPATLRVVVTAAGVEVPIEARLEGNALVIAAVEAFPPSTALELDMTETVDVIGRPVMLVDPPVALMTTETITDYTFAIAPPPGAFAGAVEGLLVGEDSAEASSALIALGDPGGSTLRITARLHCRGGMPEVALVATTGESTPVDLGGCTGDVTPVDVLVPRPAPGALWLSSWTPATFRPQWNSNRGSTQLAIEAIAVE